MVIICFSQEFSPGCRTAKYSTNELRGPKVMPDEIEFVYDNLLYAYISRQMLLFNTTLTIWTEDKTKQTRVRSFLPSGLPEKLCVIVWGSQGIEEVFLFFFFVLCPALNVLESSVQIGLKHCMTCPCKKETETPTSLPFLTGKASLSILCAFEYLTAVFTWSSA